MYEYYMTTTPSRNICDVDIQGNEQIDMATLVHVSASGRNWDIEAAAKACRPELFVPGHGALSSDPRPMALLGRALRELSKTRPQGLLRSCFPFRRMSEGAGNDVLFPWVYVAADTVVRLVDTTTAATHDRFWASTAARHLEQYIRAVAWPARMVMEKRKIEQGGPSLALEVARAIPPCYCMPYNTYTFWAESIRVCLRFPVGDHPILTPLVRSAVGRLRIVIEDNKSPTAGGMAGAGSRAIWAEIWAAYHVGDYLFHKAKERVKDAFVDADDRSARTLQYALSARALQDEHTAFAVLFRTAATENRNIQRLFNGHEFRESSHDERPLPDHLPRGYWDTSWSMYSGACHVVNHASKELPQPLVYPRLVIESQPVGNRLAGFPNPGPCGEGLERWVGKEEHDDYVDSFMCLTLADHQLTLHPAVMELVKKKQKELKMFFFLGRVPDYLVDFGPADNIVDSGPAKNFPDSGPVDTLTDSGPVDTLMDSGLANSLVGLGLLGLADNLVDAGSADNFMDLGPANNLVGSGPSGPADNLVESGPANYLTDSGLSGPSGEVDNHVDLGPADTLLNSAPADNHVDSGITNNLVDLGPANNLVGSGPWGAADNLTDSGPSGPADDLVRSGPADNRVDSVPAYYLTDSGPANNFVNLGAVDNLVGLEIANNLVDLGLVNYFVNSGPVDNLVDDEDGSVNKDGSANEDGSVNEDGEDNSDNSTNAQDSEIANSDRSNGVEEELLGSFADFEELFGGNHI